MDKNSARFYWVFFLKIIEIKEFVSCDYCSKLSDWMSWNRKFSKHFVVSFRKTYNEHPTHFSKLYFSWFCNQLPIIIDNTDHCCWCWHWIRWSSLGNCKSKTFICVCSEMLSAEAKFIIFKNCTRPVSFVHTPPVILLPSSHSNWFSLYPVREATYKRLYRDSY